MRIIAGAFKGRVLAGPKWPGLRPTSDRLRETLFDILGTSVRGARVLDAFAGTGALGIEALSRGAASVVFFERDPRAQALIAANLRRCGVAEGYVMIRAASGLRRAAGEGRGFDLILADPPYDALDLAAAVALVSAWLAPEGLLVLEHARRRPAPSETGALRCVRAVRAGDSALAFYRRPASRDDEQARAACNGPGGPERTSDE